MRKITQQIKDIFSSDSNGTINNTEVKDGCVYLLDNKIIEKRIDGIYFSLAGWNSNMTHERLRGILGIDLCRSKGKILFNGKEIDKNGWYSIAV